MLILNGNDLSNLLFKATTQPNEHNYSLIHTFPHYVSKTSFI